LIHPKTKTNDERLNSILYSKDYRIDSLTYIRDGSMEKCLIGYPPTDLTDENIRKDTLHFLNLLDIVDAIVKYRDQRDPVRINKSGQFSLLDFCLYNDISDSKDYYVDNGRLFYIKNKKRYFYLDKKEQLKKDMVVEYYNQSDWIERKVGDNINEEYDRLYRLLMKHGKLRFCFA
jgi:hypothetical protein